MWPANYPAIVPSMLPNDVITVHFKLITINIQSVLKESMGSFLVLHLQLPQVAYTCPSTTLSGPTPTPCHSVGLTQSVTLAKCNSVIVQKNLFLVYQMHLEEYFFKSCFSSTCRPNNCNINCMPGSIKTGLQKKI